MTRAHATVKPAAVNPLKMSQPLGASYAFLGMNRCMPVMHGSQGCTSFGLVLLVRHFREAIPLQTTAMNEASTIMGGMDNIEKAILNIRSRAKPDLIAICSTGLTETKGDDVHAYLQLIGQKHPELGDTALVYVSTPDYVGAFQDGWANATSALIDALVPAPASQPARRAAQVNILPGCHLSAADIDELREIVASFGLEPLVLPDISGSLDGHMNEDFSPTTTGGTTLEQARRMAESSATLAVGEQMRPCAQRLQERSGVPFEVFDRLTGLEPNDRLLAWLARLSGVPVPAKWRRQRSQLQDALLDAHFSLGGKRVAIGAEPDLLWAMASLLAEAGCRIECAVTTTESPLLERLPAGRVRIGDLEDLEDAAGGCDLLVTHSHGRQAAARLHLPLYRCGLPIFDRLGAAHRLAVGYRGTREILFEVGNLMIERQEHEHATAQSWPLPAATLQAVADATLSSP
jgi:nitrogenase molybdenum-iron protein NifN